MAKSNAYKDIKAICVARDSNGERVRDSSIHDDVIQAIKQFMSDYDSLCDAEMRRNTVKLDIDICVNVKRRLTIEGYISQIQKAVEANTKNLIVFMRRSKGMQEYLNDDIGRFIRCLNYEPVQVSPNIYEWVLVSVGFSN
jgi:hypothetical protein